MTVPYSFANATVSIPLSQLDSNFNTPITLGNTAIQLGNTVTTLNNMTLANVTISSGNVTITNVSVTTANVTTLNATTVIATTANVTTANITTGNVTNMSSGNVAITGGSINGTTLGATTASTANVTTLTTSSTVTINGGTVNGVAYLNGSKVLTTGSALTFDGTGLSVTGSTSATLKLNGRASDNGSSANFYDNTGATRYGFIYFDASTAQIATTNASPLAFLINSSEQMRLTSTGLGIGTSSPAYKLDVVGGSISASNAGNNPQLRAVDGTVIAKLQSLSVGYTGGWVGTESNHNFQLVTNNSAKATLDSSGNLGLGATPSAWGSNAKALEIGSGASTSLSFNFSETNLSTNVYRINTGASLYKATGIAMLYTQSSGGHAWSIAPSGTAGDTISFTQAMTLDASGRLGLGATSPGTNLHIGTGSSPENLGVTLSRGATTNFYLAHDGTKTFIAGIDPTNDGPKIGSLNSYPFLFVTGNSERARITSGGDLLVACTSFPSGSSAGFGFNASQYAYFSRSSGESLNLDRFTTEGKTQVLRYAGTEVGNISVTASATAYNTSSDYRLKDKPQPLTGSGAFIDSLKPKTWAWKSDGSKGVGFIAHEVQEVSPGSVVGEKDAVDAEGNPVYQAMEYGSAEFISNIIAELQSLRARVAQLEAK
jgi:hypothetical protein